MASAKDTFEATTFLPSTFACGTWRGTGVTAGVGPFCFDVIEAFSPGPASFETHSPGTDQSQAFQPGRQSSQTECH